MLAGGRDAEAGTGAERDVAGLAQRHRRHANGEADLLPDVEQLPGPIDIHGDIAGGEAAVGDRRRLHATRRKQRRYFVLADQRGVLREGALHAGVVQVELTLRVEIMCTFRTGEDQEGIGLADREAELAILGQRLGVAHEIRLGPAGRGRGRPAFSNMSRL